MLFDQNIHNKMNVCLSTKNLQGSQIKAIWFVELEVTEQGQSFCSLGKYLCHVLMSSQVMSIAVRAESLEWMILDKLILHIIVQEAFPSNLC